MAKRKNRIAIFFTEVLWEVARAYWPAILPVMTAVGQYFYVVPWPYFFAVLSVATAAGIFAIIGISKWRADRKLEGKIVISLRGLFQAQGHDNPNCRYHLNFEVYNGDPNAIYLQVQDIKWSLDDSAHQAVDISPVQGMVAPRRGVLLASSVISRPANATKSIVGGEFQIVVEIGRSFGKPTVAVKEIGGFSVLATTDKPIEMELPVSAKITELSSMPIERDD